MSLETASKMPGVWISEWQFLINFLFNLFCHRFSALLAEVSAVSLFRTPLSTRRQPLTSNRNHERLGPFPGHGESEEVRRIPGSSH
jgi:hypothetical protein